MITEILFWTGLALIAYSYVLYPLLIKALSLFLSKPHEKDLVENYPTVSILMSVYNEEEVVAGKIESLTKLNYPEDKIEFIIGSDASTDGTDRLLEEMSSTLKNLHCEYFKKRTGKPTVINQLVKLATGEIIVITDADVVPAENSLKKMISNFSDSRIGLVDSNIQCQNRYNRKRINPERAYQSYETWLKRAEGIAGGVMIGPSGGFYAFRKDLYTPVPKNFLVDDLFISINLLLKGSRSVIEIGAHAIENEACSIGDEFRRMIRISTGNFQILARFRTLLLKPWLKLFYIYISHKVLRWISPMLYILVMVCNILLIKESDLYVVLLYVQLIFLLLPVIDRVLNLFRIQLVPIRFIAHFYYMNLALLIGFLKSLGRIKSGVWEPTKRV